MTDGGLGAAPLRRTTCGGEAMLIENEFDVPASVDLVWSYLLDVDRVVPCLPGADLTETVDARTWKGRVRIKVGPVSLSFVGTVTMQEQDDIAHRVVLKASGKEEQGRGSAVATATSWLESVDGGTMVYISSELIVSGTVAQFSRGVMQDVSAKLTAQFANCLKANLAAQTAAPPGAEPPSQVTAKPIGAIRIALWALFRAITRFFRRLAGRRPTA
jgi:carbon monoxide dehydrogenase subunit G